MIAKISLLISAMRDKRTPWYATGMVVLTLAYIISPIDLIPDFIPIIGLLDEVILVPVIYKLLIQCIPKQVIVDANRTSQKEADHVGMQVLGVSIIMIIWIAFIYLIHTFL